MYEYIKGTNSGIGKDFIVIECNGIGYKIFTSNTTMGDFSDSSEEIKAYTHLVVREDDIFICGFSTYEELEVFRLLISVSGVGVKVALSILSSFNYMYLISLILDSDSKALTGAPGIGKKTAERMILELKDKMKKLYGERIHVEPSREDSVDKESFNDAVSALVALGYSKGEAAKAIKEFDGDSSDIEQLVRFALLKLSRY